MRCDECKWWCSSGGGIGKCLNAKIETITSRFESCGWHVPLNVKQDKPPKTSDELLEKSKDITRELGGEVPGEKKKRNKTWRMVRDLLNATDRTISSLRQLQSCRKALTRHTEDV